jgi:hypothetical protein
MCHYNTLGRNTKEAFLSGYDCIDCYRLDKKAIDENTVCFSQKAKIILIKYKK